MDGASKFVRGDAIAGLLILLINIVGGLTIGLTQHDLSLSEAGRIYTLLTIGDGLVAQIPSLLLSLATAIIVTRVTTSESMTEQAKQTLANPTAFCLCIWGSINNSRISTRNATLSILNTWLIRQSGLGYYAKTHINEFEQSTTRNKTRRQRFAA